MTVVVLPRSLTSIFPATPGRPAMPHRVELPDDGAAGTVGDLVAALDGTWAGVHDRLCESSDELRPFINVFVDGEPASLETPVPAGSTVHVLPAVAGG